MINPFLLPPAPSTFLFHKTSPPWYFNNFYVQLLYNKNKWGGDEGYEGDGRDGRDGGANLRDFLFFCILKNK